MRIISPSLFAVFVAISAVGLASGQVRQTSEVKQQNPVAEQPGGSNRSGESVAENSKPETASISIHLVGGGQLQVEELRETSDGIWYKRGGVTTLLDPKRVVRIERPSVTETKQVSEATQKSLRWSLADSTKVENFFLTKFGRPLPTSAFGQSDIHNRWGLDHRQGMDIGLHPDSLEGLALVEFLRTEKIPFMAFRHAIPGVATGPHIHIGNPSHRYLPR
ncbi:MAG TPA: hypothetical protein VGQ39_14780 [Pyrinomonadaceae bacterium]|nr:hypothetical protein [Pyrinomonadaceae bacterium]